MTKGKVLSVMLVSLLVTFNAQAKPMLEANNNGGGKIILTDEYCNDKVHKLAFSQMNNTSTLLGCWAGDGQFVHIRWYDNDLRSYPYNIWRVIDNPIVPTL